MVNGMKVTDVVVYPVSKGDFKAKVKAFAKVVLNDQFIINGIRIVVTDHSSYIMFPQEYNKEDHGNQYQVCHPTTQALKDHIKEQVLAEFVRVKQERQGPQITKVIVDLNSMQFTVPADFWSWNIDKRYDFIDNLLVGKTATIENITEDE